MRLRTHFDCVVQKTDNNSLFLQGQYDEQVIISVLEDSIIRVRHLPDGNPRFDRTWSIARPDGTLPVEGRARDDMSTFSCPGLSHVVDSDDRITISTTALQVIVQLNGLQLTWTDAQGNQFAQDSRHRAYQYDRESQAVYHYMQRFDDERYYGFGEKSGPVNKAGRRLRMMNVDALGYNAETTDPLYKHWPFYVTYLPEQNLAYGLFYDNLATSIFDMAKEIDAYHGNYRYYQAEMGDLDYYLIYGPSIQQVVQQFAALIGRMPMPPRWSLGYLGSTMTYTEEPDAQEQLKRFVELCADHAIPCDMFHLSSGYTTGIDDGLRYVFNWNADKVPDAAAMTQHFHDAGIHLSANIKPYFLKTHPHYEYLNSQGYFVRSADDPGIPETARLWSGGAYTSAEGAYLDFTNPAAFAWWQSQVRKQLLQKGIDSTWNDNNEYELWDDHAQCNGAGNHFALGHGRAIQTLLMVQASFEAQQEYQPELRPYVLTRAGGPGVQRYAQTWTGDNATSWNTLQYNIPMGTGMSLSGLVNIGHDVGGFFGPQPDPELFVRWMQCGIFHPRFTIHSYNTDGTVNEPWMHLDVLPLIRETMQLRYQLIPYLYSCFHHTARTGDPIVAPLFYHFQDDINCHERDFEFMLGQHLLVAPVYRPEARTRDVYLPAGTWWCNYHTAEWFEGGQHIRVDAPLNQIPLFVRNGGMISLGKAMQHVGAELDNERILRLFVHSSLESPSIFQLFEDDGVSMGYQHGELTIITITCSNDNAMIKLQIETAGDYALPYDSLNIHVISNQHGAIRVNEDVIIKDGNLYKYTLK